ncbi:DUF3159 domain-containing protein [Motilibacter deserti]|uniref:DUF3159 domain-containing protein n=1 Tax=Motilibacter deserti TaxID=2714956 RepID=A0ABX0GR99_9ACTN|nr:DUF3159 domain-containing protein [Motilibacter deserti]NHC12998.1 DUF3159 domain-containing protein [Motilibacter deserti]
MSDEHGTPARRRTSMAEIAAVPSDRPSVASLVGGARGFLEAVVPGALLVALYPATHRLGLSLGIAVTASAAVAVIRVSRRERLGPAVGSVLVTGAGALLALRSGKAEDAYLPGLVGTLFLVVVCLGSAAVRWPLVGLLLTLFGGQPVASWRESPRRLRNYRVVTTVFGLGYLVRACIQWPLYLAGSFTGMGIAKLVLGMPLYAVCGLLSWAWLRRLDRTGAGAVVPRQTRRTQAADATGAARAADPDVRAAT